MRRLKIDNVWIDTPLIEIIQEIRQYLINGKLKEIKPDGDYIMVTCPHHKGGHESHKSCGVYIGDDPNIEYGVAHCFTCGFVSSFYHFVAECFDKSDDWAKEYLKKNWGTEEDGDYFPELPEIQPFKESDKGIAKTLNKNTLEGMLDWHPYMAERKLSKRIVSLFEIKYDPKTKCLVFPVYDENHDLVLLTRRSVEGKTFIIDKKKEKPVYLLYYMIERGIDTVYVCESQINALYLCSLGYPAIATFGCNVTNKQFSILNKSGIRHYYLAFDGDEAGDHGTKLFIENINKDALVDVVNIPRGKDVNDLTEQEISKLTIEPSFSWLKNC